MDDAFSRAVADWAGFYAFTGGAAATLLGLLFVAASLRLGIFRQRQLADVGAFAAFTFAAFLVALGVSGLALAPHQRPLGLSPPVLALGLLGAAGLAAVAREWLRLNPPSGPLRPGLDPREWWAWGYLALWAAAYLGLAAVGVLLWAGRRGALVGLAVAVGALLGLASASAWAMLARARDDDPG